MPEDLIVCEVCCTKRPKSEMTECTDVEDGHMCSDVNACFGAWLTKLLYGTVSDDG